MVLVPLAMSQDECQRKMEPRDVPCQIISSYLPLDGCNKTLEVYNTSGGMMQTKNWSLMVPFCNASWNISTQGTYVYNSTIESGVVVIQSEENMTSLGVIFFVLILNLVVFLLPMFFQFSENEILNNVMKKMVWIGALLFLAFNTTIVVSLADNAGLGVNAELFLYQQIMLWAIYVSMIFLFWNVVVSTLKMWRIKKIKKTMGEE